MRYALLISYDGTNYGGWQIQKNAVTVQQKLTEALYDLLGCKCNLIASGRTDSGVHAKAQVCHFDAETSVPAEKIADALNVRLPQDISVLQSVKAPEGFDAQSSAKQKTYCYRIYLSERRHPLKDRNSVQIKYNIDLKKLERSEVLTTVRKVYKTEVKINKSDVEIYITGNGFLYNMVRTLAGTMIYFSAGRLNGEDIKNSLLNGDRNSVGKTMPAKGLTLESVDYGIDLFNSNFT